MASKTIMISEEAYEVLKRKKRKNESFTDVIMRLGAGERGSLTKLLEMVNSKEFEPISEETARSMEMASREFRKNFKLRDVKL